MNAPRHDPDELKAALDAYDAAEREQLRLDQARDEAHKKALRHGAVLNAARQRAATVLKREGGTVTYGDRFWKADQDGRVTQEPVRVNLDAIDEVKKHQATALVLTPTEPEQA